MRAVSSSRVHFLPEYHAMPFLLSVRIVARRVARRIAVFTEPRRPGYPSFSGRGSGRVTPFVHLHCHSDFSLLDGASSIDALVARARSLGMTRPRAHRPRQHVRLAGVLQGVPRSRGVKPIIGSEVYMAPGLPAGEVRHREGRPAPSPRAPGPQPTGYRNLIALSSLGYTEGFYYKPRIDDELLERHHEGLDRAERLPRRRRPRGDPQRAARRGPRARAALPRAVRPGQLLPRGAGPRDPRAGGGQPRDRAARRARPGIPLVATNDIHYTEREDARAQDVLICIGTGKKVSEGSRMKFEHPEFYFKSGDEMARHLPRAAGGDRQHRADRGVLRAGAARAAAAVPRLRGARRARPPRGTSRSSRAGALRSASPRCPPRRAKRLEYELSIITSMGFTGYFLIVWDFIHFAKEQGIAVGPGRGSGAGSLVAYSLKITDIDPLKYGLLFERFLNPERVSMPDFDIDFCHRRRDEVIAYVTRKYGEDKVGQIITFGTLKARAVIRDVARVLDLPYDEADAIAKLVPEGPKIDLDNALKENPRLEEVTEPGPPVQGAPGDQPEAGGAAPPRLHARGGHRHRPRAADAATCRCTAIPRPAPSPRSTRWTTSRNAAS